MSRLGLFWKTVSTSGKIPGYAPVDILSYEGYVPASKREAYESTWGTMKSPY